MVRLAALNSAATLACRFAPVEAGMSPMWEAIGDDDDDADEDSYHVHDDESDDSYHDNDAVILPERSQGCHQCWEQ